MDPQASLSQAECYLGPHKPDHAQAAELLDAYRTWRMGGGFEPTNGDTRYRELVARIPARIRQRFIGSLVY
jgi:hypothetical protein